MSSAAPSSPAVSLAPRALSGLRELAREGPIAVAVRGGCMAPLVVDGGRVEIVAARRYWPGDVVAFAAADGRLSLHRLLGYRPLGGRLAFVTQ
ncbi:MAG TPA: S24/S26 family peptidase, partial [Thermoanaerobaculia bacterium]